MVNALMIKWLSQGVGSAKVLFFDGKLEMKVAQMLEGVYMESGEIVPNS